MKRSFFVLVMGFFILSVGMSAWGAEVAPELFFTMKTTLTANATYTFRFSLWDTDTGGTAWVWSEEKPVKLTGVKINTYLGDSTETGLAGIDFSQQYWVQVERKTKKGFVVVGTRIMLGLTPYAIWALSPAGPQGETGPTGPKGDKGDTGDQGPQGIQGIQGIQGVKGDTGDTGPAGADGADGADGKTVLSGATDPDAGTGVDGDFYINTAANTIFGPKTAGAWGSGVSIVGPQGAKGDTGDTGLQGPKGDKGDTGDQGIQGVKGDTGDTGSQGPKGDKGDTGDQGLQGIQGIQGIQGVKGDTGDTGAKGDKGDTGDTGSQGPAGADGADGADGKTVLSGATDPDAGTGVDGDFYINTASNFIFGPKASGAWGSGVSIVGPQGAKGDTGDTGSQGAKGDKGDTGDQGLQGLQGDKGDKGDTGDQGIQGLQGIQGIQGAKGDTGDTGAAGAQGPQGLQGPQGDAGPQGVQGIQGIQGAKGDTGLSGIAAQAFVAGAGSSVSASLGFLAPTASVTISASGQKVLVDSAKAMGGSTGSGPSALYLSICYKLSTGSITAVSTTYLGPLGNSKGPVVPYGLNAIIDGLATGTYDVGLCGYSSSYTTWDLNYNGYTSAFVFVTP